nr:hypothetical protein [Tanacetum cinerariifolium]
MAATPQPPPSNPPPYATTSAANRRGAFDSNNIRQKDMFVYVVNTTRVCLVSLTALRASWVFSPNADKVLSMQDDVEEPTELQEVIKVVTTAKLMIDVVTAATTTISAAAPITAATITAASTVARRRKGVVIRDPEETSTPSTIVHTKPKSKEKEKGSWNFDREDLEMLWQIVQDRFSSSKPKNFSDDFLLTTLKYMFKNPDVKAQVWKNQKDDLAGREKISIGKVYFRADAEQYNAADIKLRLLEQSAAVGTR